jgi:hypothetical protein
VVPGGREGRGKGTGVEASEEVVVVVSGFWGVRKRLSVLVFGFAEGGGVEGLRLSDLEEGGGGDVGGGERGSVWVDCSSASIAARYK